MAKKLRIGPVGELKIASGEIRRLEVNGVTFALAKSHENLYAFAVHCPHDTCDLCEHGEIEAHEITCTCHFACFDLRTGERTMGPMVDDLPIYRVENEDGQVVVCIPED